MRSRRKSAASILPALSTRRTKANLLVRSIATKEPQLAFSGLHLGDVDVEVADRVGGKALLLGLVALDLWQAADAMPLKAAVQSRSGEVGDRRLKPVEAVIQWQQGMTPEGDHDRLLLRAQNS
jgi:hypothetical protein